MNRKLKSYSIRLKTIGPVFVGSGKEFTKKEYIFFSRGEVGILDAGKLYQFMKKRGLQREFEEYVVKDRRLDLIQWMQNYRLKPDDIRQCVKYTLDSGDTVLVRGTKPTIVECVKDSFGQAYIPGSSMKGMLRTVLLADAIISNPEEYRRQRRAVADGLRMSARNRNTYLKKETAQLEQEAFYVLERAGTRPTDAVNDMLSGLIVGDSHPIPVERLVLCQKIDRHVDGREKTMPLLRECLRPDTEITFTLTLDETGCDRTIDDICTALERFNDCYYQCFLKAFGCDRLSPEHLFLGGGVGFAGKTVVYPLFGKQDGISAAQAVFRNTNVPENHKHHLDKQLGVSPHVLKCTKYNGKLVQMGLCRIAEIKELE